MRRCWSPGLGERSAAARAAASQSGVELVINARTDVFLVGGFPASLDQVLARAKQYAEATPTRLHQRRLVFPHHVDNPLGIANPILYSACVGTSCVAVDSQDNFIQTSDRTTWTSAVNIGAATGFHRQGDCQHCVRDADAVRRGRRRGRHVDLCDPANSHDAQPDRFPTVGQTLTLAHGTVQNSSV